MRDIVAGQLDQLPAGAALGVRFARAVLGRTPELEALRAEVVRSWGRPGLVTLTFVIAATRTYPLVKYALGHARACQRLRVGGVDVRPAAAPAHAMIA